MSTSLSAAVVVAVAALLAGGAASPTSSVTSDVPKYRLDYSTPMLIAKYGYESETHTVRTEDGYLLTMHRIPNPGKPAIYLQHGLLCSSADWVVLGPEKGLAFILFNAGYDVWMGNTRGNTYSRAHATLSPKDKAFWDFDWHQMGMHDLPAMIDTILAQTNQSSLVYVGHSQGTTTFLVMASQRPEYNDKVKAFIAMAPVAFARSISSVPLRFIADNLNQFDLITNTIGMYELVPSTDFLTNITSKICADGNILQGVCTNILFAIAGYDTDQMDTENLPAIMMNIPAGASKGQIIHFGQLMNNDRFQLYDLGSVNNLLTYKSLIPPEYPLNKITTSVYLHYADNDLLATPTGVEKLQKALPNVKMVRKVPNKPFNHVDFLFARDICALIYDQVLDNIAEVLQE